MRVRGVVLCGVVWCGVVWCGSVLWVVGRKAGGAGGGHRLLVPKRKRGEARTKGGRHRPERNLGDRGGGRQGPWGRGWGMCMTWSGRRAPRLYATNPAAAPPPAPPTCAPLCRHPHGAFTPFTPPQVLAGATPAQAIAAQRAEHQQQHQQQHQHQHQHKSEQQKSEQRKPGSSGSSSAPTGRATAAGRTAVAAAAEPAGPEAASSPANRTRHDATIGSSSSSSTADELPAALAKEAMAPDPAVAAAVADAIGAQLAGAGGAAGSSNTSRGGGAAGSASDQPHPLHSSSDAAGDIAASGGGVSTSCLPPLQLPSPPQSPPLVRNRRTGEVVHRWVA